MKSALVKALAEQHIKRVSAEIAELYRLIPDLKNGHVPEAKPRAHRKPMAKAQAQKKAMHHTQTPEGRRLASLRAKRAWRERKRTANE